MVPPNQAEKMFAALKSKGVTTALVMFEGEQHGFRQVGGVGGMCARSASGQVGMPGQHAHPAAVLPGLPPASHSSLPHTSPPPT